MQANRWERISQLFDEVLTLPPAQRAGFIDTACGDDAELARELRSLVQSHERTSGPLDQAPRFRVGEDDAPDANDTAGAMVGPYRLVRQIGAGGMASVWLAERTDGVLNRTVALKRPHTRWIGSHSERVAEERDILARLEHPHIARLYDAGTAADGRPFLALEYVDGAPLTEYCENARASLRDRVELLLQVLGAIGFAHARLVIHQDLKPSNILVSASGQVSLLDFGVARLVQLDGGASPGENAPVAFTPDYASPEQIRNEPVGVTSDIYSFGVVAYELLTGHRPHRLALADREALAAALEREPPRPPSEVAEDPTRRRALRGDLDAILLKALDPLPTKRYASADAIAADLTRYLRDEPVSARPGGAGYRLRKFVARYRWQTAFAAAGIAAMAIGTGVAVSQARQARAEAERAEAVKGFALALLEGADTDSGAGEKTTVAELLDAARAKIDAELADRPAIASELLGAVGYGLVGHSRIEAGADVLARARALSTQANGADAAVTVRIATMHGEALAQLGRTEPALALLRDSVTRARAAGDWRTEVDAWRWQSFALVDAGRLDEAIAAARAAVAAVPEPPPEDVRSLRAARNAYFALSNVLGNANRAGDVDASRRAIAFTDRIPGASSSEAGFMERVALGRALVRDGQAREGVQELTRGYEGLRQLLGPDHHATATAANLLGGSLLEVGDPRGALKYQLASVAATERRPDSHAPISRGIVHYSAGSALLAAGDAIAALAQFEKALPHLVEAQGPTGMLVLRTRSVAALALARAGRLAEAERAFDALRDQPFAGMDAAAHTGRVAELRSLQGRHREAMELARQSDAGMQSAPTELMRAQSRARLGRTLVDGGATAEGVSLLESAIEVLQRRQLPESTQLAEAKAALERGRSAGPSPAPAAAPAPLAQ